MIQWNEVWTNLPTFQKYAERQLSKPEVRDGMELVPQPDDSASLCQCHRRRPLRQEL